MVRIGFDFDGVILESAAFKRREIKRLYNITLETWQLSANVIRNFVSNREIRHAIGKVAAETIYFDLTSKKIKEILPKLKMSDIELYIISRRGISPKASEVIRSVIEKLELVEFFKEIICCQTDDEKIEIIKEKSIDLYIDDKIENIEKLSGIIPLPILFDEYNLIKRGLLKLNQEVTVVNKIEELLVYSDTLLLINKAISVLTNKKIISRCNNYKIISCSNNIVATVNSFYLKIYKGNSSIKDNEILLYEKLGDTPFFKKIVCKDSVATNKCFDFALFQTIEGKTLDLIQYNNKEAKKIAAAIYQFINYTSQIKCNGFGDVDGQFNGKYHNFQEYIFQFQHATATTLYLNNKTRKYSIIAYKLLVLFEKKFKISKAYIIPIDLNFKNIMINNNFEVKIVDPGALIAGPVEMAYGEFCAHSYGTLIYKEFNKLINKTKTCDEILVRIYAIFSLLNVLAFIVKRDAVDINLVKPFGNNKTFFELIDEHLKFLGGTS